MRCGIVWFCLILFLILFLEVSAVSGYCTPLPPLPPPPPASDWSPQYARPAPTWGTKGQMHGCCIALQMISVNDQQPFHSALDGIVNV